MDYNVIDADGHILEPPDLWEKYIDPKFRKDCPKLITTEEGDEIFKIEGDDAFDLSRGKRRVRLGALGTIGARSGGIVSRRVPYVEGRKGGFDPHARPGHGRRGNRCGFPVPEPRPFPGRNTE